MRRTAVCVALSAVLHLGLALALGLAGGLFFSPHVDVTWLDLDNRLGAPKVTAPPRPQAKAAPPRPEPKPQPKPRPRPKPRPQGDQLAMASGARDAGAPPVDAGPPAREPAGRFTTDRVVLSELAPGDAALMLLLRMDRIRRSPYEAAVRRLLEVFYDHKTILWASGLDPVNDFDALLIATPNPYRVTETFLAGRTTRSLAELRRGLERAASFGKKRLRWTRSGTSLRGEIPSPPKLAHDPRQLFLQARLVVLSDPKNLGLLTSGAGGPDAGVGGASWIARLGLMGDRGGMGPDGPGLLLQAINLSRLVVLPPDLPAPSNLQVTVPARDPARVEAVLTFSSVALARTFATAAPRRVDALKDSWRMKLLGVSALLAGITFQRKDSAVTISTRLTGDQVRAVLEVMRNLIPQVQVPGMPDRTPPDAGPPPAPAASRGRDAGGPVDARRVQ